MDVIIEGWLFCLGESLQETEGVPGAHILPMDEDGFAVAGLGKVQAKA